MRLMLLALPLLAVACASAEKNFDQVPRVPASHPLDPKYIRGPLDPSMDETLVRRNLSRGSGFIFGKRFLFESEGFRNYAGQPSHSGTCFLFETDATHRRELEPESWDMSLETLDGKISHPLKLEMDSENRERLSSERLPFTIRGHACTLATLPYEEGFRVTALLKADGEKSPKPSVYEWKPWVPGSSRDLDRKRW